MVLGYLQIALYTEAPLTGTSLILLPPLQNTVGNAERGFNLLMLRQAYMTKIKQVETILSQEKILPATHFRTQVLQALPKFWEICINCFTLIAVQLYASHTAILGPYTCTGQDMDMQSQPPRDSEPGGF